MKIYSSTLGREIDLATFTQNDPTGRPLTIVLHRALEAFVCETDEINYDFTCVCSDRNHCVVKCNMWFKDAHNALSERRVQTHGEAVPETLTSDIARNYPYVMAEKRAFDRAAIRLLNLPQSTYSESEIDLLDMCSDVDAPVSTASASKSAVSSGITTYEEIGIDNDFDIGGGIMTSSDEDELFPTGEDIVITDDVQDNGINTDVVIEDTVEDIVVDDVTAVAEEPVANAMSEEDADLANYVITMPGKHKNSQLTIAEIYATDFQWFEWMVNNFTPRNAVATRDIAKMKEYYEKKRK